MLFDVYGLVSFHYMLRVLDFCTGFLCVRVTGVFALRVFACGLYILALVALRTVDILI